MNSIHEVWEEELSGAQAQSIDRNQIGEGPLTEEQEIYKENILDHYRNPRNFGTMLSCSFSRQEHNPLCGDKLEIYVDVKDDKVAKVTFNGKGCAVSQASASMLTEHITGMPLSSIKNITRDDVITMLGIPLGPVRLKCALLALKTLIEGLHTYEAQL